MVTLTLASDLENNKGFFFLPSATLQVPSLNGIACNLPLMCCQTERCTNAQTYNKQINRQTSPLPNTIIHPSIKDGISQFFIITKSIKDQSTDDPHLSKKSKDHMLTNLQIAMGLPFNQSSKTVQEPCCILNANHSL